MILRNSARCPKCGDHVESLNRHDYRSCKCGAIAVDGGFDYLRRTYDTGVKPEDTSIFYPCLARDHNGVLGVICGFYLVYGPNTEGNCRYYGVRYYWGWSVETGDPWSCPELLDPQNLEGKGENFWRPFDFDQHMNRDGSVSVQS